MNRNTKNAEIVTKNPRYVFKKMLPPHSIKTL